MKRLRNWQSRLQTCLAERWTTPFKWGEMDCVLFPADCIEACTGEDLAAEFRGTYSDAISAGRIIDKYGGLEAIAASYLGPEINPILAQPGDIAMLTNQGRPCLAVSTGFGWVAPGADGVNILPNNHAMKAWRLIKNQD